MREQRGGEIPEAIGLDLQDGEGGLVREGRGWVPGLDMWAEDEGEVVGVFLGNQGGDGGVDGREHLRGEAAGVVEVCCLQERVLS